MKKELEKSLRDIQSNPASGTSNTEKITFVQVEEIFAIDKLTEEVTVLKDNLADYNQASIRENRSLRYFTIALMVVAALQLLIAYGQYKLGEVQMDASRDQVQLQQAVWDYEKMRNDRLEMRDVQWRREDLESQGRLP